MVFYWSLSNSKSLQVSRTFLNILAVLNNVVTWMVSTRPLISKSSSPFNNPLRTIPKALITSGIIVTFMFHGFLIPKKILGTYPSFHFLSILLCEVHNFTSTFFFFLLMLIIIRYGRPAEIRWFVLSQNLIGD